MSIVRKAFYGSLRRLVPQEDIDVQTARFSRFSARRWHCGTASPPNFLSRYLQIIKTVAFAHQDLELFPAEATPVTLQFSICSRQDVAGVLALGVNGVVHSMRFSWNCSPATLPRIRGHNLAPSFVYDMQHRVKAVLTHWVQNFLLTHAGQGQTGVCTLETAEYISRLLIKGHLRMPCIKLRARIPHLCRGTIVNKTLVADYALARMEEAVQTVYGQLDLTTDGW